MPVLGLPSNKCHTRPSVERIAGWLVHSMTRWLVCFEAISSHLSLNHEGRWGTTDHFATNVLHFSRFSTALWDLANSKSVHSLMLSSNLFSVCLVFFPLSLCPARWFQPDLMNGRHDHTTAVFVSLRWSGGLRVVRLPAGS